MSLLKEAYKSLDGLLGSASNTQPTQEEIDRLAQLSAQRGGVMNASVESPHYQDMYTPNENFGKQVHQTYGSPETWNEFGDQASKTFNELGYNVDRKILFPTNVHLAASEGRDIPYGNRMQGRDFHEMTWLEKDRLANISQHYSNTTDWQLAPLHSNNEGLLDAFGLYRQSVDSANPGLGLGDNSYLGVSRQGMEESRGTTIPPGAPNFEEHFIPPIRSTPWHEYGHYLDVWASNGNGSLSQIALSLQLPPSSPHRDLTAQDHYEAWMNDPRTAHLDVISNYMKDDNKNTLTNPREILGKFYVTAMLNPIQRPDGGNWSMEENIARAIGKYFNPKQTQVEGHSQEIKDMRGDVIGALANLLNQ